MLLDTMADKITAKDLAENKSDFVLIDVREADEVAEDGMIQGAVNIPLGQLIRKERQGGLDDLKGKTISMWGLAFKRQKLDIREPQALENIKELFAAGAKVVAYDPEAMDNVKAIYGDQITFATGNMAALEGADALMIMTEWPAFRTPDFDEIKRKLKTPVIFDGRNLYNVAQLKEYGFTYYSIGRK
jgi:UDP-glucose 6-dehydrogenase